MHKFRCLVVVAVARSWQLPFLSFRPPPSTLLCTLIPGFADSGETLIVNLAVTPFLPAAKQTGHRTESVVLLLLLVVVVISTGIKLKMAMLEVHVRG